MKKTIALSFVFILAASALPLQAAEVVEAVVIRVGDRIITRTQYQRRLREGLAEMEQNAGADSQEKRAAFKQNLITEMTSELLIKDRADRIGITVSDREIQDAVVRLKGQYGIKTDEEFAESLKKSGLTRPEMEARLRDTLLTNKVFARELRSREDLSDKELRERFEREKERYKLPERAKLREIIVVIPEGADEAAKARLRAQADEAYARAKQGEDFGTLVTNYSGAPSKDKAGDVGEVARGELLPILDAGVFASDAGSVVGPIETRFGYHIVRVEQRMPAEVPNFDTVKDRLRNDAGEESFQRDYKSYVERLRKDAYIQVFEANIPS